MMRFANVLLETNPRSVSYPTLYCKSDSPIVREPSTGEWTMLNAGLYDFNTYFNSLSVRKLRTYTTAKRFFLHLELRGAACIIRETRGGVFSAHPELVDSVVRESPRSDDWRREDIELEADDSDVLLGFTIETTGTVAIRNSYYSVDYDGDPRTVELVLATTTFRKEKFIERNVAAIRRDILESGEEISGHFHMYVMDNGRTLDADALSGDGVSILPNDNVGGAGGFTRGMIEAMEQTPKATHILMMDDDVAVSPESIKRTFNLLRIVRDEYAEAFVSGAMLNYEIGDEQWEDMGFMTREGTFAPVKPFLRLTKYEDVVFNEVYRLQKFQKGAMYAAWWYCCIPISVIEREGLPLPVFVRCDDAEYGVRCQPRFITMNGLCIWHMSFHARYNAAVERYQTTRNTMIAQATTGFAPKSDFMYELHNNIRLELKKFGYDNAELCLDAFEDFLKGPGFIAEHGAAERSFMDANKRKERMVPFPELEKQARKMGLDFRMSSIDRQLVDSDKPRTRLQRLADYVTDNGQRIIRTEGKGYVVIPYLGWLYPAGVIRGKKIIIVIDWYNKTGAIRVKDPDRFDAITKRYHADLRYYKRNIDRLRKEYASSRKRLTSMAFWKDYLGLD